MEVKNAISSQDGTLGMIEVNPANPLYRRVFFVEGDFVEQVSESDFMRYGTRARRYGTNLKPADLVVG